MLTISKPLSAGQAQTYHAKEFTAKEQNYWSQRGVIQGEWQGRLSGQFGLAGAVTAEDFARLSRGEHPATGEQLVRQRAAYEYKDADGKTVKTMEHRAGWDATFSAPKSISLIALVGGDENVRVAHRESVRVALEQLENYTQARIGSNHPPETTAKFIAAKFEHDTARPVDGYVAPQLHTHAVVFNVTERDNGQSRAIQPQSLFASQQFATAVYQSELTYRLRQLGYEIAVGRSGAPEIKGYTQEYLDASSPRSQQIRAYLERTGHTGKEAAEIAAHSTRDRKEIHSPGEVMAAHRKLAADFGHQAEGFAPTSRAARQLNDAGVESGTLQGFLARSPNPAAQEQRHFCFVDESSLASTNQMREFLSRLGPHDRVLLIGDTRQHQGVEAGRPFEQLQEAGMRTAKLDEIVRQKDPALKSAVELLAKGQVSAALESLQKQGRVKKIPGTEDRIRAIAKSYVESPEKTLIVSPDNASRRELNIAVRQELKANGTLAPEDHTFRVLVQRQDMTGAERSWASHYEINDVLRYARGSKAVGIEAGTYGSVVAIDPAANLLTVDKSSGEQATYDPHRLTGVSVYREINREFSVGDRIQFTAPDKSLGVANRDLAAIESIAPDGRISATLDSGRQVEFNAQEHRHFDHGYAVTSHSSQGLTVERVLINADAGVHPDLLNSRFGYVSISRASHEATMFTNDAAKLSEQLGTEVGKTAALEISQPIPAAQGLEISLG
jgi:conjugative relaxase-like TrwC/TraI family protein